MVRVETLFFVDLKQAWFEQKILQDAAFKMRIKCTDNACFTPNST